MIQARMDFNKVSTLFAAAMAISTPAAAKAACDPAAGLTFICGLTNAEDLIQVPDTPWVVASGLAEGEHTEGHIYFVNAHERTVQVLLPGHVVYQQETEIFGACPGAPDETKFSAHGLSLRVGSTSEHTLYVVHHGERESVEVFKAKAGPLAPTLTWVGCVVYPAGVLGNGVAALPGDAFAASNFTSTNDPKAADKLMAGQPEGGMLIWRPKTGWEDVPEATTISADNGVAASPDGKQLFVAGSGDETVVRLSIDSTPGDRGCHQDGIPYGQSALGLGWLPVRQGTARHRAKLVGLRSKHKQRCTSPFSVVRIDPVTLQTREVVRHPRGPTFGAASTALRIGDEYWFGTPRGDRIAIALADSE